MMGAMTSLASLGHSTHAPMFNTVFYATVAAVIPTYFIALVVQGGTYQGLLKGRIAARRGGRRPSGALGAPP
jgi:hypothetical protein